MKKLATISIAIAVHNEQTNIGNCLKAVHSWVDEIVLVDGQSNDKTITIVKSYPKVKIISVTNKAMFHINKQIAIDKCKSDWTFQLDADEIVSPELKKEIQSILTKHPSAVTENGFWINRKNFFLTKFLKKGGQYPDPLARLYKKGQGKLPCLSIHEKTNINPPVGQLQNPLLHYADLHFSRYLTRNNRYTSLMADDLKKQKVKINLSSFIKYFFIKPSVTFVQIYFRHLGFLDGFPGLIFAYYSGISHRAAYTKYYNKKKA